MTTLSTHDTKRSDDVRARLAVLTEIPGKWRNALAHWSRRNRPYRTGDWPDRNTEYFLYQTLIGAWPISRERMIPYMEKAVREAKQQTNWTQPNKEFEDALRNFIERILDAQEFVSSLDDFVSKIVHAGRINSLAQTLLKLTAPGVPDTYQGSEVWDLSLVDPDNRRSVDFEQRRQMLAQLLSGMSPNSILEHMGCGMPKMWIVHVALTLRRQHPEWFGDSAAYTPILAEGNRSEHLVGFVRGDSVITLVSRWSARLAGNWAASTVTLPQGAWNNRLTCELVPGGRVRLQTLFSKFPVALLVREAG